MLAQDVRYGARTIRRRPGFALITILTIALGISAPATIFTIGNALLFRAAPGVAEQDRLIEIVRTEGQDFGVRFTSYPDYVDMRERVTRLESVYALPARDAGDANHGDAGVAVRVGRFTYTLS